MNTISKEKAAQYRHIRDICNELLAAIDDDVECTLQYEGEGAAAGWLKGPPIEDRVAFYISTTYRVVRPLQSTDKERPVKPISDKRKNEIKRQAQFLFELDKAMESGQSHTLQCREDGCSDWVDCDVGIEDRTHFGLGYVYRIVPVPPEIWINRYSSVLIKGAYLTEAKASACARPNCRGQECYVRKETTDGP